MGPPERQRAGSPPQPTPPPTSPPAYIPGGTPEEQEAFGRLFDAFPLSTVGPFEPYPRHEVLVPNGDERPDAILPELEPFPMPPQLTDGLSFAMGAASDEPAIWGGVDAIAWAPGEATGLVGPDGVGKTTLVHRLALGLAGIEGKLLGLPITSADGRVLLVAADRPKQAARSMWRMLVELDSRHHGKLRDSVLVWRGPLPFDLVKAPGELAVWAKGFGASHVILDSLGFVASRLTEDETGSAIAQAFMACSVASLELFWTGHPRKASGENKKPNAIADVYGSRWITAASGSILSLWASSGDPVVELRQLKSPSGEVGPFLVELDHEKGTISVLEGTDLLGHLRASPAGLSRKEAGRLMEGASERAREVKAGRHLDKLVARSLAYRREGEPIRGGVHEPDRYFATPPRGHQEQAE
jgi:replicative DNA helicase